MLEDRLTAPGRIHLAPGADLELLARSFEQGFERETMPTLGVEEELILIDRDSLEPVDAGWVLAALDDETRFKPELRSAQLELVTPVCFTAADICRELARARDQVVSAIAGRARIIAVGTHPTSTKPVALNPHRRYREIALDNPWFVRCGMPSALHIHVGVGNSSEALAIYNAARSYLPELAALAANSPFFEGRDTGLASCRLKLCEDAPRTGIPPPFDSWHELARFVAWGASGGLFPDLSYLWWDLRPRPDYGTLEFRITDSQTHLDSTAAIVAVCQSLVTFLQTRLRSGEQLPSHPTHVLSENRWRALRDGLNGELVDPGTCKAEPTRERVARLLDELHPHALKLRCADELAHAQRLLKHGNGANEQRTIVQRHGLERLVEWLADTSERTAQLPRHIVGLASAGIEPTFSTPTRRPLVAVSADGRSPERSRP